VTGPSADPMADPMADPAVDPVAEPAVDLVVGVGSDHGDDAAGLLVARRLRGSGGRARVCELSGDLTSLADLWEPAERVAVVDAIRSGGPAGSVRVLDATAAPLPAELAATSTHGLGLAAAVELARVLGRLPRRLTVYAVEGQVWEPGAAPSPAVLAAVERTAAALGAPGGRAAAGDERPAGQEP
jgi:hydrogenase maturation protease